MAAITESIQNDWESREVLEMVQLKVCVCVCVCVSHFVSLSH